MKTFITLSFIILKIGLGATYADDTNINSFTLGALLKPVQPWPSSSADYPRSNWIHLVTVARILQKSSPIAAEQAFQQYQTASKSRDFQRFTQKQLEDDTKLYLLLRVVFAVPESVQLNGKPTVVFGFWTGRWLKKNGETNPDGSFNPSWPVGWNQGQPKLLAGWIALEGIDARYKAAEEYKYFRSKYPFRDLSSFKDSSDDDHAP